MNTTEKIHNAIFSSDSLEEMEILINEIVSDEQAMDKKPRVEFEPEDGEEAVSIPTVEFEPEDDEDTYVEPCTESRSLEDIEHCCPEPMPLIDKELLTTMQWLVSDDRD